MIVQKITQPYFEVTNTQNKSSFVYRLLASSNHGLDLFTEDELNSVVRNITLENRDKAYIKCLVRGRNITLKPEEVVRQLYLNRLIQKYGYPIDRLKVEYPVKMGVETKKADVVVLNNDHRDSIDIVIELKKPNVSKGRDQLKSYCNATGASMGVWTNGQKITHYHRKEPNIYDNITDIPNVDQKLDDIISERFTIRDLIVTDKIANEKNHFGK